MNRVNFLNNRGEVGNQLMVFTFFLLLFIIAIGIVAGVYMLYGDEYDFREVKANILNQKVKNCVLENSLGDLKEDFYSLCMLNEEVVKKYSTIKICIGSEDCISEESEGKIIFSEGSNFQICELNTADTFPKCFADSFMKKGESIEVIVSDNQLRRRV